MMALVHSSQALDSICTAGHQLDGPRGYRCTLHRVTSLDPAVSSYENQEQLSVIPQIDEYNVVEVITVTILITTAQCTFLN